MKHSPLAKKPLRTLGVIWFLLCAHFVIGAGGRAASLPSLMGNIDRGVVAVRTTTTDAFVSWRLIGTESSDTAFNLYRITDGNIAAPVKLNIAPLTQGTNFTDATADFTKKNSYIVRAIAADGVDLPAGNTISDSRTETGANTIAAGAPVQPYLRIPLSIPVSGTTPAGEVYTYSPGDCSVGDLDGDGEYEIVVKWNPSNAKDNSQSGYTGNVYLDAYKLDGTQLWRIDLGKNIRAGEHYTQFMVYDLDGDGKAEIACKTADGTKDGRGTIIGDANADWRNSNGYILTGPEYLTIFNGATGAAMKTVSYLPPRGNVSDWGDSYGNRVDRFLACIAYLDGQRPSLVMCRGYYTRTTLAAWDWRDGQLTQRWFFDSDDGTPGNTAYRGQGNHQLSVADVDGDGCDEIIYGACTIDHDGKGLYSTGLRHGDKLHVAQMNPAKDQLLVWACHEEVSKNGWIGHTLRDAKTGDVLFSLPGTTDTDGAMAADIDPRNPGYEIWGARSNIRSAITYQEIVPVKPSTTFAVWWDGDLLREIYSNGVIYKWNWNTNKMDTLFAPDGIVKSEKPLLSGDLFGDWREEVIVAESDNNALRIYIPTAPTDHRITTLMHDRQYRLGIAWQNVAYNQTPHPGFYLGHNMPQPPAPNIVTSLDELLGPPAPVITAITPDTGVSAADFITSAANITLHGTAEPDVTVNLTLVAFGITRTTQADAAGNWTLSFADITLPEGKSSFTATATGADNRTGARSQPFTVTVMTAPPSAPAIVSITGDGETCAITGTAQPDSLLTMSVTTLGGLGPVEVGTDGIWTITCPLASLPSGECSFTATAADKAGNAAAASSSTVSLNTTVAAPIIAGLANDTGASPADRITSNKRPMLHGTATTGDTITISFIGSGDTLGTTTADPNGAWSFEYPHAAGLADGNYAFTAAATRAATGTSLSAPAFVVTIDTTAPSVTSITRPGPDTGAAVVFNVSFSEGITGASAASFTPVFTGGVTGAITDVTALNSTFLAVTVGNLDGDGTLRLDVNTAVSGITDIAGNALAATSITSETIIRARYGDGTWANEISGGLWSDADNWLEGTRAQGLSKAADFSAISPAQDTTVILDVTGTVGKILFGDTDPTLSTSWSIIPLASGPAPALRLAVASGTPEINVSNLALDAQATIAAPLAGTQGLVKTGGSLLVLTGSNALTGALTVNTGELSIGLGGILNIGNNTAGISANTKFSVTGGFFRTDGRFDLGANSGLIVQSGSARAASIRSASSDGGYLLISGGTLSCDNINIRRSGDTFATGVIVTDGYAALANITLGSADSYGTMSVEGGNVLVTGTFIVANQTSAGRGGKLRVTGGKLVSTETANGLVLAKTNGSNANNVATATFSGGEAAFEKITLGFDGAVTSGSATITVDGGALYLGSGGIVKNGTIGLAGKITLASGTLGAKAAWTTTHPVTLTSNIVLQTSADITLAGAISGTGGFTKTGAGTLTLSGTNIFSGMAAINEGTLAVSGTFAKFAKLTWDSAAALQLDIVRGDRLVITGALTKTGSGARTVSLTNATALTAGSTRTLATFGSTTLTSADFATIPLSNGLEGKLTVSATALALTVATAGPADKPTFTSPATATGTTGSDFNYAITVDNTATSYSATGLPSGLSINTNTGVISGKPTVSGTFTATLSATNSRGTTNFTLTLNIAAAPTHTALVTLAGVAQSSGTANGQTTAARFKSPAALIAHANGNLYIADTDNNAIRVIDAHGNVSTLATTGGALALPGALITGTGGTLIVADTGNNAIRSLNPATGQLTTLVTGIPQPEGLARDAAGNLYIAATTSHAILKFAPGATASSTLAIGFNNPTALAIGLDGFLYVADTLNHAIRKVDTVSGEITTAAGQPGASGATNGPALTARLNKPEGLAFDIAGNLYIADTGNHTIRYLDVITDEVTTLIGAPQTSGTADGLAPNARLNTPTGFAIDAATGDIYIADTGNHTIRVLLDGPRILKHPENQGISAGATASFTVLAIGAPTPAYQWQKSGSLITGATDYTYTIANAQTMHAGSYSVVVKNEMNSVISNAATLTVTATSSGSTTPPPGGSDGGGGATGVWHWLALALLIALRGIKCGVAFGRSTHFGEQF